MDDRHNPLHHAPIILKAEFVRPRNQKCGLGQSSRMFYLLHSCYQVQPALIQPYFSRKSLDRNSASNGSIKTENQSSGILPRCREQASRSSYTTATDGWSFSW